MSPPADRASVADRPDRHRYEIELDGQTAGLLSYRLVDDVITHRHTEIDPSVGGRDRPIPQTLAMFSELAENARARRAPNACTRASMSYRRLALRFICALLSCQRSYRWRTPSERLHHRVACKSTRAGSAAR